MLQLNKVSIAFGGRCLLDSVDWHLPFKGRVGLVGANGSGKSTLMKLVAGLVRPDDGSIAMPKGTTIGYLPQEGAVHAGRTLFDEAATAFQNVLALQEEQAALEEAMHVVDGATEEFHDLSERYAEVLEHLRVREGHQLEAKVEKVLRGLGFGHDDMRRLCEEFSGGWQMRIALAKILLAEPSLLLLDEPTNYLDLEAREFLEDWLLRYPCALILVSHDRYFLDRVINRVTEVFNGGLDDYHCSYSRYLVEREERVGLLRKKAQEIKDERERIQSFINRFRFKADKAALVQSRVRQLEKLKDIALPPERKKMHFRFPQPPRSGETVLEVSGMSAGYEGRPDVFTGASFKVSRGEKVPLVGVNGAGKTTLIKIIAGLKEPREGTFKLGHNVTIDYFAQDTTSQLDPDATVYETVERVSPFDFVPRLRGLLGAFLFSGDDIEKKVSVLSGGEKNRLALARMLLKPANFLLMDEPTNHLDLESKEVLLESLKSFQGTVLFVSHDRYFLDNLSTEVIALENGGLNTYPGSYPDFMWHLQRRAAAEAASQAASPDQDSPEAPSVQSANKGERARAWEEDKRKKRERDRLEKLVHQLEAEIVRAESDLKNLDLQMAEPRYATDFSELTKMLNRRENAQRELDRLNRDWEDAFEKLQESAE